MPRKDPTDVLPHLRRALKERWPAVKFSVRRHRGTAYGWASITYEDGPNYAAVKSLCSRYQREQFNGMIDAYDPVSDNDVPSGCSGLSGTSVERTYSPRFRQRLVAEAVRRHPELAPFLTPEALEKNYPDWPRSGGGYVSPHTILWTLAEDRTATLWHLLPDQKAA